MVHRNGSIVQMQEKGVGVDASSITIGGCVAYHGTARQVNLYVNKHGHATAAASRAIPFDRAVG